MPPPSPLRWGRDHGMGRNGAPNSVCCGDLGLTYPAPMSFNNTWHYCPVPTALPPCKLELWLRKTRFLIGVSRDGSAGGCYQEVISEGKIIAERSGGSSHLTPRRSSHTRIL